MRFGTPTRALIKLRVTIFTTDNAITILMMKSAAPGQTIALANASSPL